MSAHPPHKLLKAIRKELLITQPRAAELLGVSYPYFLSIETGQRELSLPLANKVAKTFGVVNVGDKDAKPLMRDPKSKAQVPFTRERYLEYSTGRPSFFFEDVGRVATPTLDDYMRCTHALLKAAEEEKQLRPVLFDFFTWFRQSNNNVAMLDSLKRNFELLYPGKLKTSDAFAALTLDWENEALHHEETMQKRRDADSERKRRRKQKNT